MVFTIEPILTFFPTDVEGSLALEEDNWTVVAPMNPSAQWEHMVLVTADGCEVLTQFTA